MTTVRLNYREGDHRDVDMKHIRPYELDDKGGRHPVVRLKPDANCDIMYLLGSLYRGEPLVLRENGEGDGGEIVDLRGVRSIRIFPNGAPTDQQRAPG
ncbi:MAG: hypothetical protein ABH864_04110 [archaeon]